MCCWNTLPWRRGSFARRRLACLSLHMVKWFCSPCTSSNNIEQQGRIYLQLQPKSSILGGDSESLFSTNQLTCQGVPTYSFFTHHPQGFPGSSNLRSESVSKEFCSVTGRCLSLGGGYPILQKWKKKHSWCTQLINVRLPFPEIISSEVLGFLVVDC